MLTNSPNVGTIWRVYYGRGPGFSPADISPYVMIDASPIAISATLIIWDLRLKAPAMNFLHKAFTGAIINAVEELVGIYHAVDFYGDPNILKEHSLDEFVLGNKAGINGEALTWEEILELYTC